MEININLSINTKEKDILKNALLIYDDFLEKELIDAKYGYMEVAQNIYNIKKATNEMYEQLNSL